MVYRIRKRINITVSKITDKIVSDIAKKHRMSKGQVFDKLVADNSTNKLEIIEEKLREYAKMINDLQDQKSRLLDGQKNEGTA